jgi:hypothetical protein
VYFNAKKIKRYSFSFGKSRTLQVTEGSNETNSEMFPRGKKGRMW